MAVLRTRASRPSQREIRKYEFVYLRVCVFVCLCLYVCARVGGRLRFESAIVFENYFFRANKAAF